MRVFEWSLFGSANEDVSQGLHILVSFLHLGSSSRSNRRQIESSIYPPTPTFRSSTFPPPRESLDSKLSHGNIPPIAMPFTSYQTTVVGWLIRQVTGHRALKYPDEIALPESEQNRYTKNPQVDDNGEKLSPKKQQQKKERLQQDQAQGQPGQQRRTDSRESEETRVQEGGADGGDSEEKGKDPNLVEWYGPDDPENPKNVRLASTDVSGSWRVCRSAFGDRRRSTNFAS
jgi:hypothetical protein